MRDVMVGVVTAVVAVAATAWLRPAGPAAAPSPEPAVAVASEGPRASVWAPGRTRIAAATQPDAALARFEATLVNARFDRLPLAEAIDYVRDVTGVNTWVNWRALEAAGVDPVAPVTLDLQGVRAPIVLRAVLRSVDAVSTLGYRFADGILTISTAEDLDRETVLRAYDVRDIVDRLAPAAVETVRSGDGAATQPAQVGGNFCWGMPAPGYTKLEAAESVARLLQSSVAPESWRDAGGTVGWVHVLGGHLFIVQTPEGHAEIEEIMTWFRWEQTP